MIKVQGMSWPCAPMTVQSFILLVTLFWGMTYSLLIALKMI